MISNITRRNFVAAGLAAGAVATAAGTAMAMNHGGGKKHMHQHKNMGNKDLAHIAFHCVYKGQVCLDHCLTLFQSGDTSIADCAREVQLMLPMCQTMSTHAKAGSKHVKALAKTCIGVCKDCKVECDKHADKHVECKDCSEACDALIKKCEELLAA